MWVLQFGFTGGRADGGSAPSDHPDVRPPNDNLGAFYLAVCPNEPYKLGRGVKSVQHPLNIDMVTQGRVSRDSADVWLEAGPDGTVRPMLLPTKSKMLQLNQKPVSQQKHAMVLVDGDRITLCKQNYAVVKQQPLVLCVSSKLPSAERAKVDLAVQQLEELTKSKITVVQRMKQGVTHYVSQSIPGGLSSSLLDVLCMCVPVVTFEFVEDLVKIVKGRKPVPTKLDDYWPNTARLSTRMSNSRSLTSQHSTHLTLGKSVRVNLAVCPWRTTLLKGYTVVLAMSSPTAAKCFYRIMEKMGAVELLLLSTIADQVEVSERLKPQCSSVVIFYDDSVDPCWDAFKRIQMNDLGIGIASGAKELFFEQPPSHIDQQGDDDFKTLPTIKEEPVTQVSATSQHHKRTPSMDLSSSSTVPKRAKLEEDQENLSAADISLKTERPPPLAVAGSRPNTMLKSDEVVFDSGSDSEDGKVLLAMSTRQKRKLDDLSAARKKPATAFLNVKEEPVAESDKGKMSQGEMKRTRRSLSPDTNQATVAGNIKSESSGEAPTASTTTAVSVKLEDESGHAQESSLHDEAWPHEYDSDDDDDDKGETLQNKQNASIDRGVGPESHLYVCARDEIEPEKADKLWKELEKQCQALLEPKVSEPAQPRRRFRKNKVLRAREERPDEEISWELYKFDENDCAAVRKIGEELIKEEERMHQAFIDLNDMGSSASMGKLRDVLPESGSTAGTKRRTAAKGRTRVGGRANRT